MGPNKTTGLKFTKGFFYHHYPPFFLQGSAKIRMKQNLMTPEEKSAPTFEKSPTPHSPTNKFWNKTFKKCPLLTTPFLNPFFCSKKLVKLDPHIFWMWILQPWNKSCGARPLHLPTPSPLAHAAVVPCWSCASCASHTPLDGRTAWRTGGFLDLTSLLIWGQWDMLDLPRTQ